MKFRSFGDSTSSATRNTTLQCPVISSVLLFKVQQQLTQYVMVVNIVDMFLLRPLHPITLRTITATFEKQEVSMFCIMLQMLGSLNIKKFQGQFQ